MMKYRGANFILRIIPFLLFFLNFYAAGAAAAEIMDSAFIVTLKKNAVVSDERIKLGDIAFVEPNEDFSIKRNDIENIEIGISPKPFLDRKITAGEVRAAILKKIRLPGNATISMAGEAFCFVKYHEREDVKAFKSKIKKNLEEKIGELFTKEFGPKIGITAGDSLEIKIISGINAGLIKKIFATDEVSISISSYKTGIASISIKTTGDDLKLTVKISKSSTLLKAAAKIKKGTAVNFEQLRTESASLPPEKFLEFIVSAEELLKQQKDNNIELIKDLLPNEPLRKNYFKKKQLINAGQKILLSVSNNNSIITFDAIAEGGGAIGDEISAVNTRTRKKYRVRITGSGTAEAL